MHIKYEGENINEGGIVVESRRFNFHVEFLQACLRLFSGQDIVHRTRRLITAVKLDQIKRCQNKLNNISGSMAAKGLYFNSLLANFNDSSGMV